MSSADEIVEACAGACDQLAQRENQIIKHNRQSRMPFKASLYRRQAFKEAAATIRRLLCRNGSAAASPTAVEPSATTKDSPSGSVSDIGALFLSSSDACGPAQSDSPSAGASSSDSSSGSTGCGGD